MLMRNILALLALLCCGVRGTAESAVPVVHADYWDAPIEVAIASGVGNFRLNGLNVRTVQVRSPLTPERLLALFEHAWRRQSAPALIRERTPDWITLGRRLGTRHQTLQLQPADGGARGYLAEIDLAERPASVAAPLMDLPAGVRVSSVVEPSDTIDEATHISAHSRRGAQAVARDLRRTWSRGRWVVEHASMQRGVYTWSVQRGAAWVRLTLIGDARGSRLEWVQQAAGAAGVTGGASP